MTHMAAQRSALAVARRLRGEMLIAVHEGILTVEDVIDVAHLPSNQALRRIPLKQLMLSSGMSNRQWYDVRARMLGALGAECHDRDLTIGWLLDPRAGGRRHYAFRDALRSRADPPWMGFPWRRDLPRS